MQTCKSCGCQNLPTCTWSEQQVKYSPCSIHGLRPIIMICNVHNVYYCSARTHQDAKKVQRSSMGRQSRSWNSCRQRHWKGREIFKAFAEIFSGLCWKKIRQKIADGKNVRDSLFLCAAWRRSPFWSRNLINILNSDVLLFRKFKVKEFMWYVSSK